MAIKTYYFSENWVIFLIVIIGGIEISTLIVLQKEDVDPFLILKNGRP
jgi:hypothetical protein